MAMNDRQYIWHHPSSMTALWRALDKLKTFEVTMVTCNRLGHNVLDAMTLHVICGHCDALPEDFNLLHGRMSS